MKSYKDLEIYKLSFQLALDVHKLTLTLPKTEQYELGSQVRRSAQSVRANIVEGYGRKDYKTEFVRFLVIANASLLETESHLEMLCEIYKKEQIKRLIESYKELGKKLYKFIMYVQNNWKTKSKDN